MFGFGVNPNPVPGLNRLADSVNLDESFALNHKDELCDFLVVVGLLAPCRVIDDPAERDTQIEMRKNVRKNFRAVEALLHFR